MHTQTHQSKLLTWQGDIHYSFNQHWNNDDLSGPWPSAHPSLYSRNVTTCDTPRHRDPKCFIPSLGTNKSIVNESCYGLYRGVKWSSSPPRWFLAHGRPRDSIGGSAHPAATCRKALFHVGISNERYTPYGA